MSKFVDGIQFNTLACARCGVHFAITDDYMSRRRNDHNTFYCPEGHPNVYNVKSEAEKLRETLAKRDSELAHAQRVAASARSERDTITKAHRRMRKRVMNGVCPCCNRSFDNLRQHMATQHADFGAEATLKALRESFGMTQADVAKEAGVRTPAYVSMYENGKPVPVEARESLDWWLESQGARA